MLRRTCMDCKPQDNLMGCWEENITRDCKTCNQDENICKWALMPFSQTMGICNTHLVIRIEKIRKYKREAERREYANTKM